ncbi:hypothetical protein SAMN02745164_02175 [Marinitoga hydrogenitolerans DSM 16785]|uniref:Uncharacterized protein n=1 Tax=Marinitoga hydrogenitolerans (strain DSM 16785 / JCM 12826 / AT1271) TaxID=1122195 RepID=A0A1M5AER7_MARH1|nr:hypothetical protein [Marinitoga hydrogenitolerans]SHF28800.1 hypothetical protein SAMN02745164_02175 [Marinitoga hydrogenitolerans DSM 16785]
MKKGFILYELLIVLLIESLLFISFSIIIKYSFFDDLKKRIDFIEMMDYFLQVKYHSINFEDQSTKIVISSKSYFDGIIYKEIPYKTTDYTKIFKYYNLILKSPGNTLKIGNANLVILPITSSFRWSGIEW